LTASWTVSRRKALRGELRVPGDKSISHRALMLSALADGETAVEGLSSSADVASTKACLEALGVGFRQDGAVLRVRGRGLGGLSAPTRELDAGNSGTTMRLMAGILAGHPFGATLTGDASLRRRPMKRVAEPLRAMGATVELEGGERAPLTLRGGRLKGIGFDSPVASAQVKSAILLAGLHAEGTTSVREPALSRDHTERMLAHFGVVVDREGLRVSLRGGQRLKAHALEVPGDPSSAAFWAAAACLVPDSEVVVRGVCANPTRIGFFEVLKRMGARLELVASEIGPGGEPVADLYAGHSDLKAVETPAEGFPAFIDEVPLLCVVATQATGTTVIRGTAELRHKESDRIETTLALLRAFGASAGVEGDDIIIPGGQRLQAGIADPKADHRIAMSGAVAALAASGRCEVLDPGCADISYPGFFSQLDGLLT